MSNQSNLRTLKNERHPSASDLPLLKAVPDHEPEIIDAEYVPLGQDPYVERDTNRGDAHAHQAGGANDVRFQGDSTPAASDPDNSEADNEHLAWILQIDSRTRQTDRCRYIRKWAKGVAPLPELERLAELGRAAEALKWAHVHPPTAILKAALKEAEGQVPGRVANAESSTTFKVVDPVPSSEPVTGADLASSLEAVLRKYTVLSGPSYVAVVLWILFTFVFDRFSICPLLVFASPTLRCGKSTLMALLSALVPRAIKTSNLTRAALYRISDALQPTLLLDEFETYSLGDENMRGIINGGHLKSQAFVVRAGGTGATAFSSWCPKALALIGTLPATLWDRSVVVPMHRKAPSQRVEQLRLDRLSEFQPLVQQAARWALDHGEELARAEPLVPPEMQSDRARDNWRPLLAIAEALGGDWAARARQAALELSAVVDDGLRGDIGVLLLQDMRTIFETRNSERLDTSVVLRDLAGMDERPWATFSGRRAMGPQRLANLLRPFGIQSKKWAEGGPERDFHRGYVRRDFAKAFESYLPQNPPHPPQPPQPKPPKKRTNPVLPPPSRPRP